MGTISNNYANVTVYKTTAGEPSIAWGGKFTEDTSELTIIRFYPNNETFEPWQLPQHLA